MKKLVYLLLSITALTLLTACGSVKSVVKTDTRVNLRSTTQADSASFKVVDVKTYGDTLRSSNFVPSVVLTDTALVASTPSKSPPVGKTLAADTSYTITAESDGIKFKETFTPEYNKGRFIGDETNITAIAKPIAATDTHERATASVRTTTVKDSAAKADSTTTKTIGWGLPSWVWWIVGVIIVFALVYVFKTYLKLF